MAKKKAYKCKVCGKTYLGYRKSGTCSLECSLIYTMTTLKAVRDFWRKNKEKFRQLVKRRTKKELRKRSRKSKS